MDSATHAGVEAVVRGYCFQRSFAHPYLAEQVDGVWRLYDEPRAKGTRREEFFALETEPADVHAAARCHAQGHYCICALHDAHEVDAARDAYKALDYRLNHSEFFMRHPLRRIPRVAPPLPLQRVTTRQMADRLATTARRRQILPEHLEDPAAPIRVYVALDGDAIVGWVISVSAGAAAYCGGMYVKPDYRRRGIARSLLARMLRDDRAAGAGQAVLLASHTGAMLYPVVGYEEIGKLLVFTPKRR